MYTKTLKELQSAKAKVTKLESRLERERSAALADLPAAHGFASAKEFARAVKAASLGTERGGKRVRKRAVITDDTRAEVKKLLDAGKKGLEIAARVGISLPSVMNIKRALGLIKPRKGKKAA